MTKCRSCFFKTCGTKTIEILRIFGADASEKIESNEPDKERGITVYLHVGQDTLVRMSEVVGIFDLDNSSIAKSTRDYLADVQKKGQVITVTNEIPKSFIVCQGAGGAKIYISQISPATLKKRAGFIDNISNVG